MKFLNFLPLAVVSLLGGLSLALSSPPDAENAMRSPVANSARSVNTCADHSLAKTVYQSFRADATVHVLNYRHAFESVNTGSQASIWADIQPSFRAWPTQQNFTVPLFQLGTADGTQYIYRTGADASTPPVVSGFNPATFIVGWVYDSQVCGSVPLMSASFARLTDHYFTIDTFEHDGLVTGGMGWADSGVVAFVLPLSDS